MPDEPEQQVSEVDELRKQLATRDKDMRRLQLTGMLTKLGAPEAIADVYGGDVDEGKLKAFVQSLQVPPGEPTKAPDAKATDTSGWDRYEGAQGAGAPAGTEPDDVDKLLKRGLDAIEKSKPSMNPFDVTEAERLDQRQFAADVNKLHREWERGVRRRTQQPAYRGLEGFGGRMDPPDYAYKAQDRELLTP